MRLVRDDIERRVRQLAGELTNRPNDSGIRPLLGRSGNRRVERRLMGGSNASLLTNSSASGAPTSRSIPASSHSMDSGPS